MNKTDKAETDSLVASVVITRSNHFNGRGVLTPFSWLYSLKGETPNYEGTPLQGLRRIAKRIAASRGVNVVEDWK